MKRFNKIFVFIFIAITALFMSGCTNDSMDNIEIIVTNYPNEYVVSALYGEHATITSTYPDGVDTNDYKVSNKQKKDYSKKDLFVYNGLLEKERNLAVDLLAINPDLKIIDTAYVLETDYSPEELWLNPSSLLMMSQNVRLSLNEYVSSSILKDEIEENYNNLKIELSEIDADYRFAVDSTDNKTIVVANSALKYLEKFGLEVICIDSDATQKSLADAEKLIKSGSVSYVMIFKGDSINEHTKELMDNYPNLKTIELHKLDNLSGEERSEKKNYSSIMNDNLELIKQELYQ